MIFKKQLANDKDFDLSWNLYVKSFPRHERRSKDAHVQAMKNPNFNCTAIYEETLFVGIMFYWEKEDFIYIEHLAISEELRGKNYGSKIMKEFCSAYPNLILEIEPPIDDYTKKRLRFYEKLDFVLSDFHYIHPSYTKDGMPHRLDIMYYKKKLDEKDFKKFIKFIKEETLKYID